MGTKFDRNVLSSDPKLSDQPAFKYPGLLGFVEDLYRIGRLGCLLGFLGFDDFGFGQLDFLGLLLGLRETIPSPIGRGYQKGCVCCRKYLGLTWQTIKNNSMIHSRTSHTCHTKLGTSWGRVCLG